MRKFLFITMLIGLAMGFLVACQRGAPGAAVPDAYAGKENPYSSDSVAVAAGQTIYENRCVRCHGEEARGEGSVSGLNPPPSNLIRSFDMHDDDYLYWRIAEGGEGNPLQSAMPAFMSVLSDEEIWQVLSYIEQLD
jgi:mono/diheme cytochrome c family protein